MSRLMTDEETTTVYRLVADATGPNTMPAGVCQEEYVSVVMLAHLANGFQMNLIGHGLNPDVALVRAMTREFIEHCFEKMDAIIQKHIPGGVPNDPFRPPSGPQSGCRTPRPSQN